MPRCSFKPYIPFVFLATSATAVTPTVAAVLAVYAGLVFACGTHGSPSLAPAAKDAAVIASGDGGGGDGDGDGNGGGGALSVMGAVALVTLMSCSGALMCAISRAEDRRSRGNFVKEFRRRQEQRRWAALISNMLPPAVVTLLQKKNKGRNNGKTTMTTTTTPRNSRDVGVDAPGGAEGGGHGRSDDGGDDDDGAPPTMAWKLPHACIFQSDIVGFTALTQRIQPTQLVSMLHSLFAAYDRVCAKHDVQKIETIGDAYLAATGCTAGVCPITFLYSLST